MACRDPARSTAWQHLLGTPVAASMRCSSCSPDVSLGSRNMCRNPADISTVTQLNDGNKLSSVAWFRQVHVTLPKPYQVLKLIIVNAPLVGCSTYWGAGDWPVRSKSTFRVHGNAISISGTDNMLVDWLSVSWCDSLWRALKVYSNSLCTRAYRWCAGSERARWQITTAVNMIPTRYVGRTDLPLPSGLIWFSCQRETSRVICIVKEWTTTTRLRWPNLFLQE